MTTTHKLVDIEFATSQLGGNAELLAKMLYKFCDEFEKSPQQIKEAIQQNDMHALKLKVHTTKGLSGNIGLTALYECSKLLDQQIRQDCVDPQQVDAFETIMGNTIAHIKTLDLVTEAPSPFTPFDASDTNNLRAEFVKCLKRNEFIDDDKLHTYIDSLSFTAAEKQQVKTLVEDLQYTKAIEMITQVK